jgi:hypothetical protein
MAVIKVLNLLLAFVLELAMLAAFGWAALQLGGWQGWVAAVAAVALAIVLWARWAAPRSPRRLKGGALLGLKIVMFVLAVMALEVAGQEGLAVLFTVLAAANLTLAQVWRQEGVV